MLFNLRNLAIIAKIAIPATIVAVVSIGIVLYASLAVTQLSDTAAALVARTARCGTKLSTTGRPGSPG